MGELQLFTAKVLANIYRQRYALLLFFSGISFVVLQHKGISLPLAHWQNMFQGHTGLHTSLADTDPWGGGGATGGFLLYTFS